MKPSFYNYKYEFEKNDKKYKVLYNTLYGSVLLLDEDIDFEDVSSIKAQDREVLEKCRFLIPDDLNELDLIRSQNKIQRFSELTLELTILPTRWCNLNCQYCFEDRKNINMSDDDIDSIYKLVTKRISKINCVSLLWFGGEPLLQIDKIYDLSKKIQKLAKEKNVQFKNSIITNGTLLNEEYCEKLKECGMKYMQITLDGPAEVHNKRKPTMSGGDTFDLVLKNIIRASKDFDLSVRINIDKDNKSSIRDLIDILAKHKLQDKIYIYIAKVESVTGACGDISGTCLKDADFLNAEHKTLEYLREKGFSKSAVPSYRLNYCTADNIHSFSLLPEGAVHKCWHLVGEDAEVVGNLTSEGEIIYNDKLYQWLAYDPLDNKKCSKCKILPLCMGGCPKSKIVDDTNRCDFLKNIIENYLEKTVLTDMEQ